MKKKFDVNGLYAFNIPNGVREIARSDFEFKGECTLKTIILPSSLEKIHDDVYEVFKNIEKCYYESDLHGWLNIEIDFPLFSCPRGVRLFISPTDSFGNKISDDYQELIEYKHPDIVHTIGDYQLYNIVSIKKVAFPYNNLVLKIGRHAFSRCVNIKEIKLSFKTIDIDDYAFSETSFESIDIPPLVEKLGYAIFKGNKELRKVRILSDVYPLDTNRDWLEGSSAEVEIVGEYLTHSNEA